MMYTTFAVVAMLVGSKQAGADKPKETARNLRAGNVDAALAERDLLIDGPDGKANELDLVVHSASGHRQLAETQEMNIYTGFWGDWKNWVMEDSGSSKYACGAQMRFEKSQGGGSKQDDTAGNGLQLLFCDITQWNSQYWKMIDPGHWGDWQKQVSCPYNKYINGGQVRYEGKQGDGDDTALNGLKIHCVNKDGSGGEWQTVYEGLWGDWKSPVINPNKMLVKGARMQIESQIDGDDTAWNGLEFKMEKAPIGMSLQKPRGYWRLVKSAAIVDFEVTESMETTDGRSMTKEKSKSLTTTVGMSFEASYGVATVGASIEVSGAIAESVASTISSEVTRTFSKTERYRCPKPPSGGYMTMWQWVMTQAEDANGPGFTLLSSSHRCVPNTDAESGKPPRCVEGYCTNDACQKCSDPLAEIYKA